MKTVSIKTDNQKKKKSEYNQMREDDERLKGIELCKVLGCSVLEFGMDHTNKHKVKEIKFLIWYHFGS